LAGVWFDGRSCVRVRLAERGRGRGRFVGGRTRRPFPGWRVGVVEAGGNATMLTPTNGNRLPPSCRLTIPRSRDSWKQDPLRADVLSRLTSAKGAPPLVRPRHHTSLKKRKAPHLVWWRANGTYFHWPSASGLQVSSRQTQTLDCTPGLQR